MNQRETQDKVSMFEQTILELGAELYNLRAVVTRTQQSHDQFLATIKGLKQLLDEKGLITSDDFDAAVDLGEAIERFSSQHEHAAHQELERLKKSGH